MQARPFGSTALRVTPVGLGLAAVGRPGYINLDRQEDLGNDRTVEAMEARTHQLLDAVYDAGVRYVDVARSYGQAEAFLASWLAQRHLPPGSLTVGSKWGYTYTAGWQVDAEAHEVKDHSLDALRRQLVETRAILGDHFSLYQIHSATLEGAVLENRGVLRELADISHEGLVVGLTVSGPRQAEVIRRALAVDVDGINPFRSVQATWNLLEPSAGPALAEAAEAGWGVIVKEALANGRLSPRTGEGDLEPLRSAASWHGATLDQVAMAAALSQPWADVVLSGAVTVAQLHSNLGALAIGLTPEDREDLSRLAEPPAAYWDERRSLGWS